VVGEGGGEGFTHETWVGLVSGRRLRPVPDLGAGCARSVRTVLGEDHVVLDLGAGCACSVQSWPWERMAYGAYVKPVSGRRFRPVLDLGAGCARSVQAWKRSVYEAQGGPSGGGSSARSLISTAECTC
jgi:hypothetical protein